MYAVKNDGSGARAIADSSDCLEDEYFSVEQPAIPEADPRAAMEVTNFQAQAALHRAGLHETVEALMTDPATDFEARLAWRRAQTFSRLSATVISMGAALGLTDAQLDDLFIVAATIRA